MAHEMAVDSVAVVRSLFVDAVEAAREAIEQIHANRRSTGMALVLHFRHGEPIEIHQYDPEERPRRPARIIRRRR